MLDEKFFVLCFAALLQFLDMCLDMHAYMHMYMYMYVSVYICMCTCMCRCVRISTATFFVYAYVTYMYVCGSDLQV